VPRRHGREGRVLPRLTDLSRSVEHRRDPILPYVSVVLRAPRSALRWGSIALWGLRTRAAGPILGGSPPAVPRYAVFPPPAPPPAVAVRDLWVRFGEVEAVRGIDLTVEPGAAVGLLGRNGAGKSTTMKVLAGVFPATEGTVLVAGIEQRRDPLRVKQLVGYCPDVGGLVPRATPWEHLQLSARLRRL